MSPSMHLAACPPTVCATQVDEENSAQLPAHRAQLEDAEVVRRVVDGDTQLFEILMRRYNPRLFRVARSIVRDDAEAEDVMQDAYIAAFANLASFEGRSSFATWLTRIAVHEAFARLRKQKRQVELEAFPEPKAVAGSSLAGGSPAVSPERDAANGELRATLRRAIDRLPAKLRLVFILCEVEGLTSPQAASALGISAINARVRLHRARSALHDEVQRLIGTETQSLYSFHLDRCDRVVEAVLSRVLKQG